MPSSDGGSDTSRGNSRSAAAPLEKVRSKKWSRYGRKPKSERLSRRAARRRGDFYPRANLPEGVRGSRPVAEGDLGLQRSRAASRTPLRRGSQSGRADFGGLRRE